MIIRSVGEILKDRPLHSIAPDATLQQACEMLDENNIGALAVMEHGKLVGVLSERDVIRRAVSKARQVDATKVADVMTPQPQSVAPDTSLAAAMEAMMSGGFRHLPVVAGDRVLGMLSMRDIPTEYRLMVERYAASFSELAAIRPQHA